MGFKAIVSFPLFNCTYMRNYYSSAQSHVRCHVFSNSNVVNLGSVYGSAIKYIDNIYCIYSYVWSIIEN
jgi:hypothetical protein